jgi:hypothetical protein
MAKTKDRVSDAADTVKPYVERAFKDEELRENVKSAFEAARDVYNELFAGRGMVPVATRVATDKDIQDSLKSAVDDLRSAADRLRGKEEHATRNTFFLLIGIAIGVLFNPVTGPATRKWISDKVFGSSDDFTYQSSGDSASSGSSSSGSTSAATSGSSEG